ncbi:helicase-associated domain-containing protein [Planococcus sp. APC 4015]|nr:helicase-associated domain-containing protein [Planococcus sp. APC 4015]
MATWLSSRDDVALAAVFAARGVSTSASWNDFFDAAAALLDPASVDRAISRLPRTALIALVDPDAATSDLVAPELALLDEAGAPLSSTTDRIANFARQRPAAFEPPAAPVEPEKGGEAAAAERAFTTAGALADLLLASLRTPLTRTGAGAVSAVDRKRLVDARIVSTAEELEDLVTAAVAAGLAQAVDREWIVTDAGERWLELPTADRWRTVIEGFLRSLPAGLRTADGGVLDPQQWAHAYPLDPDWAERAARIERIAVLWGLRSEDGLEPSWTTAIRAGAPLEVEAFAGELPAEIDRVYLQADLTAIAPGPLAPALDLRLRRIAHRESRAQASTYRFTAESLGAGVAEGESAESIREFLTGLSLSGIPQPLDYLIESTTARHGLVRVRSDAAPGRTRVESTDAGILNAIAVDQALRPLGLVRDDGALVSRVAREAVFWSLADARYPVTALDENGDPEPLHRRTPAPAVAPQLSAVETYARVIAALRSTHGSDGDAAWLGRELEQAVRAKSTIIVVVRLPDGVERTFTLEASGLGGGRLRGRDRAADIERTLPVSHIVSVRAG